MNQKAVRSDSSLLAPDQLLDFAGALLECRSLEALSSRVLPWVEGVTGAGAAFLSLAPPPLAGEPFFHRGLTVREASEAEALCESLFRFADENRTDGLPGVGALPQDTSGYRLWGLELGRGLRGVLGIKVCSHVLPVDEEIMTPLTRFLAQSVAAALDRAGVERRITHFNAYLTVSSLLARSTGLQNLLETALYFCTEAVGAQEASALFLDEDRKRFRFYRTEGTSRAVLEGDSFPADQGIAGAVLKAGQSEIIQDVQHDPRFYGRFDVKSGVVTRNMIAVPLVAGEEPVGVLEVINKAGGLPFAEEDRLLLHFIAEEIAFAVRNARLFELVADSYCKQRQGQASCEGCRRPLGSWTPCLKYRAESRR